MRFHLNIYIFLQSLLLSLSLLLDVNHAFQVNNQRCHPITNTFYNDIITKTIKSSLIEVREKAANGHDNDNETDENQFHGHQDRRNFLNNVAFGGLAATSWILPPFRAAHAETVGKDENCNDPSCVGVWDGLLADCPHGLNALGGGLGGAGCASSQDDTPGVFAEPWDYSENDNLDWKKQMTLLVPAIQSMSLKRGDRVEILLESDRYLRVLFTDGKNDAQKSLGEFYFTPNDTTVQFRIGSLANNNKAPSNVFMTGIAYQNMDRSEAIRKQMRYLKIPVLRNRKRTLFFVESDLDQFGPGSASLGPPAEMKAGELEGRPDVDPRLKIDSVQFFPKR